MKSAQQQRAKVNLFGARSERSLANSEDNHSRFRFLFCSNPLITVFLDSTAKMKFFVRLVNSNFKIFFGIHCNKWGKNTCDCSCASLCRFFFLFCVACLCFRKLRNPLLWELTQTHIICILEIFLNIFLTWFPFSKANLRLHLHPPTIIYSTQSTKSPKTHRVWPMTTKSFRSRSTPKSSRHRPDSSFSTMTIRRLAPMLLTAVWLPASHRTAAWRHHANRNSYAVLELQPAKLLIIKRKRAATSRGIMDALVMSRAINREKFCACQKVQKKIDSCWTQSK
jgi:hypothetical protein